MDSYKFKDKLEHLSWTQLLLSENVIAYEDILPGEDYYLYNRAFFPLNEYKKQKAQFLEITEFIGKTYFSFWTYTTTSRAKDVGFLDPLKYEIDWILTEK